MTPEQWAAYGGCPSCEAVPGAPCRDVPTGIVRGNPHPARPLAITPDTAANIMDDLVAVRVREGVTVHPGDTLVLRIDPEVVFPDQVEQMNGEMEQVRAYVNAQLPRGARCIVIAANGELGVVRGKTAAPETDAGPVGSGHGAVGATGVGLLRPAPEDAPRGHAEDHETDEGPAVPGGAA